MQLPKFYQMIAIDREAYQKLKRNEKVKFWCDLMKFATEELTKVVTHNLKISHDNRTEKQRTDQTVTGGD